MAAAAWQGLSSGAELLGDKVLRAAYMPAWMDMLALTALSALLSICALSTLSHLVCCPPTRLHADPTEYFERYPTAHILASSDDLSPSNPKGDDGLEQVDAIHSAMNIGGCSLPLVSLFSIKGGNGWAVAAVVVTQPHLDLVVRPGYALQLICTAVLSRQPCRPAVLPARRQQPGFPPAHF